jgi:hypothetical protein
VRFYEKFGVDAPGTPFCVEYVNDKAFTNEAYTPKYRVVTGTAAGRRGVSNMLEFRAVQWRETVYTG